MKIVRILAALLIVSAFAALFLISPFSKLTKNPQNSNALIKLPQTNKPAQKNSNFQVAPQISAQSAVVIDAKTGEVFFGKNPNARLLPASTTKLMSALVALKNCSQSDQVTVGLVEKEPNSMGISTGDVVTVESLLYGMLINSANDAAFVLSYSCAPSTEQFVAQMNQEAKNLNMKNTKFTNPAGFDDQQEYSSANDLAKLAKVAVTNPLIFKIVSTKSKVVTDVSGNKTYYLESVNKLLGEVDGVEGVKTGQTQGALQVLISQTTRNGNTIIAVVLGSQDRFLESKNLIEWAYTNFNWSN